MKIKIRRERYDCWYLNILAITVAVVCGLGILRHLSRYFILGFNPTPFFDQLVCFLGAVAGVAYLFKANWAAIGLAAIAGLGMLKAIASGNTVTVAIHVYVLILLALPLMSSKKGKM